MSYIVVAVLLALALPTIRRFFGERRSARALQKRVDRALAVGAGVGRQEAGPRAPTRSGWSSDNLDAPGSTGAGAASSLYDLLVGTLAFAGLVVALCHL
jgi:hypothetical protein